jgi:hypothetical protein
VSPGIQAAPREHFELTQVILEIPAQFVAQGRVESGPLHVRQEQLSDRIANRAGQMAAETGPQQRRPRPDGAEQRIADDPPAVLLFEGQPVPRGATPRKPNRSCNTATGSRTRSSKNNSLIRPAGNAS